MRFRHAAALSLVTTITVVCLASCATTHKFEEMAGESQANGVVILSYKFGMFGAAHGDNEQGDALATSNCTGCGYSGAIRYGENEQCLTQDWGIPDLFVACSENLVKRSYHCLGATAL